MPVEDVTMTTSTTITSVQHDLSASPTLDMAHSQLDISLVIPVFNERDNLKPLYWKLKQVMDSLGLSYEILFIDDGSLDGSTAVLQQLSQSDQKTRVIEFVRNFGQTAAIAAGFKHARGEIIIPMDADLQNDPEDIPRIIDRLQEGYDVVSCWRSKRKDSWFRVFLSRIANRLISWISGVPLHDYGCTLKAYRHNVVRHIHLYGEMHRFIPIYASWAGARITELEVRHHPRRHGQSKYGLSRTIKVVLDLITIQFLGRFSTKPMYLFGGLGFLSFSGATVLSAVTLYQRYFEGVRAHRNPLLILAIFGLIAGLQFVLFGLLAELITRTYHESQNKPTYIVRGQEFENGRAKTEKGHHSSLTGSDAVPPRLTNS